MRTTKGTRSGSRAGGVSVEAGRNFAEHARVTVKATVPDDSDALAVSLCRLGLCRSGSIELQSVEITLSRAELCGFAELFAELAYNVWEHDVSVLGGKGNGSRQATFLERNPGWLRRKVRQSA